MNCKTNVLIVVGLFLYIVSFPTMALPLQEAPEQLISGGDKTVDDTLMIQGSVHKPEVIFKSAMPAMEQKNNPIIPSASDMDNADFEMMNLNESFYYERQKKKDSKQFYSSGYSNTQQNEALSISDQENSSISTLLQPLTTDPELKEKAKDALETIKNAKELLVSNKEVSYESSVQTTDQIYEKHLIRQRHQESQGQKGINNKVSKEKYDSSMFRELFSQVITILLYIVAAIIFMKLVFVFVAWQRKINRY